MERIDVTNFNIIHDEPRGFTKKHWVFNGINQLIKYNNVLYNDQDVMEYISSVIFKTIDISCVNVSLG